jgi:LL-diaminopimelate aminotransferase
MSIYSIPVVSIHTKYLGGVVYGLPLTNTEDFSLYHLNKAFICTVPWNSPEPYVRFSVTFEAKNFDEKKKNN